MNTKVISGLSLHQPYASLLVIGAKRIETRSWECKKRGWVVVHAAKKWNRELINTCWEQEFRDAMCNHELRIPPKFGLPFGALIGLIQVVACFPFGNATHRLKTSSGDIVCPPAVGSREHAFGDYYPGRFGFLTDNFYQFNDPVPYKGGQGWMNIPIEVIPQDGIDHIKKCEALWQTKPPV